MNCPHCNKFIYGLTGLQEIQAFSKHLRKCKKYQNSLLSPLIDAGRPEPMRLAGQRPADIMTALKQRANSGQ
jgi:hypothetical protein